jgi:hypothetical protein
VEHRTLDIRIPTDANPFNIESTLNGSFKDKEIEPATEK